MSEEWGPWIDHDGRGCPVSSVMVQAVRICRARGRLPCKVFYIPSSGGGKSWDWQNYPTWTKVIRYRIRKPKGMVILESLIADLPETVEV
jgi:hypothetical protein